MSFALVEGDVVLYDASGNPLTIVDDSGTYRLAGIHKVQNVAGAQVNPSTENTLATRASESSLVTRASEATLATRASEATLAQADGRLATIDSVLDSVKDTDGIKKITDQLPVGVNEIGKVAQGTKAANNAAWPEYLVDGSGNVVGVVLDGSVYRLQSDAKTAKGASDLVHLDAIDVSSGIGRLKSTLFSQDGDPIAFGSVAPNPESIKNEFTTEPGDSDDLLVDGDPTPVVFTYDADASHDISILEVKLVIVSNSLTFGGDKFGAIVSLTNGVKVEVTSNGNTGTVFVLKQNEDFVNFASPGGFDWVVSSKDMIYSTWLVGGGLKLKAGTPDNVKVTVQDDIGSAGVYFKCFVKGNILD